MEEFIEHYYNNYSSIAINKFCREHKISSQQFHYHKKRMSNTKNLTNIKFQELTINYF